MQSIRLFLRVLFIGFWVLDVRVWQDKRPQPPTAITPLIRGVGPNMLQLIGELPGEMTSLLRAEEEGGRGRTRRSQKATET